MQDDLKAKLAAAAAALSVGFFVNETPTGDGLGAYQQRCTQALTYFITQVPRIEPAGRYKVTFGDAFRPISVARSYAQAGVGIANSLHTKRLAIDLNLFVDGVFAKDSDAHKPLADLWLIVGKEFSVIPAAGVYFSNPDGNHYSCAWENIK